MDFLSHNLFDDVNKEIIPAKSVRNDLGPVSSWSNYIHAHLTQTCVMVCAHVYLHSGFTKSIANISHVSQHIRWRKWFEDCFLLSTRFSFTKEEHRAMNKQPSEHKMEEMSGQ